MTFFFKISFLLAFLTKVTTIICATKKEQELNLCSNFRSIACNDKIIQDRNSINQAINFTEEVRYMYISVYVYINRDTVNSQ